MKDILKYKYIYLLLLFTATYAIKGNPDNIIWSGLHFTVTYLTMLYLFLKHPNQRIKYIGVSLCITYLVYIFIRYIVGIDLNRIYNIIPFCISYAGLHILGLKNIRKEWGM